ncbi:DUF5956 family protein [Micromonospora echinospora]|uniref:DUF5956 family protein n=1 Tax=Micromonospora echinospora TaxID=1877 RepID=UPI0033F9EC97
MSNDQAATATPRWDDVPVLAEPPGAGYYELTENGWGAIIGWFSGVDRMVRCPDRLPHMVTEECTDRNGTRRRVVPRTPEDRQYIDDSINEYLRDAGAPTRPGGYRWFLRLPEGYTGIEVEGAVNRAVMALPPEHVHPSQFAPCIRETLQRIYVGS